MRCENCGRDIDNAELWRIAGDPNAPTSWTMRQLCWDCRQAPQRAAEREREARRAEASQQSETARAS
ncbi:MAG: hypothetical protein OJF49_001448 [Ktedonobacterales bacterium]|jgi:hypothetical protein|nr:MAG: hypothetical protein OJF49_001448 [Ktedonobacterales bacterium]